MPNLKRLRAGRAEGRSPARDQLRRLVRRAREQIEGLSIDSNEALNWPTKRPRAQKATPEGDDRRRYQDLESPDLQQEDKMARVARFCGIEPPTLRFSVAILEFEEGQSNS